MKIFVSYRTSSWRAKFHRYVQKGRQLVRKSIFKDSEIYSLRHRWCLLVTERQARVVIGANSSSALLDCRFDWNSAYKVCAWHAIFRQLLFVNYSNTRSLTRVYALANFWMCTSNFLRVFQGVTTIKL